MSNANMSDKVTANDQAAAITNDDGELRQEELNNVAGGRGPATDTSDFRARGEDTSDFRARNDDSKSDFRA